jgi:hypothetical protein
MLDIPKRENFTEKEKDRNEPAIDFDVEKLDAVPKKEISPAEKNVADSLRREIELMEADGELKAEAKKKALKIEFLGEQEKIEHLLDIAREKGVVSAIKTAMEMKDPYLLDALHDILAKESFYKTIPQFKKSDDDDDDKN